MEIRAISESAIVDGSTSPCTLGCAASGHLDLMVWRT